MSNTATDDPFHLPIKSGLLRYLINKIVGFDRMAEIYANKPENATTPEFLQYGLDVLGVTLDLKNPENFEAIPREGPVLIVANHPLGGLEGVAIAKIIADIRPDLQVLTNELLRRIPELAEIFIGVNVLSKDAAKQNVAGIKQAHSHLKGGGALLVFPAGVVSTYEMTHRAIADRPWNRLAGQLVKRAECPCVPINVGGRNSLYFYLAGLIHPRLRTVLLPRQLLNKQGYTLPLTIGGTIPHQELAGLESPKAITEYLRISTDALSVPPGQKDSDMKNAEKFALDVRQERLQEAIADLEDCRLVEHRDFDVYCASHARLGDIMEQIAISREVTFRMVGEGTGLAKDTDQFDPHYLHLFLWDKEQGRVAGAYRIGRVDEIVRAHGVKGLYSRSLYKYDSAFIRQLGSAIEMGRSFIHPDYQRRPIALNLMWRGIGVFLIQNPDYHTLFGSVSISRQYTDMARELMADSLLTNYRADGFQDLVQPITPHKVKHRVWTDETLSELANVKILSKLVGRCDPGKAVPVLLRHYLSLNGRFVCFNVHPHFNDSLEGLIIVDLRLCDTKTAIRFMGEEGYNQFIANHQLADSA